MQLPNTIAWDTSGFGKEAYMLSAIHYVFDRASHIAQAYDLDELPLVLNFSYGWSAGRHDGGSEMEIAIEDLLQARRAVQSKTALVMPTGNNFASEMHARLDERDFDNATAKIGWHLPPDDRTSSFFELWFPKGFDPDGYQLSLSLPHGATLDQDIQFDVGADHFRTGDPRRFAELELDGQNIGQISADLHFGNRWRVMIALIPTSYTRRQSRKAPAGLWTISLHRSTSAIRLSDEQGLAIWLQRDDDPSDLKSYGRQSYLVNLSERDTVSGFGALNAVASSPSTTRVAGYNAATGKASDFSGANGVAETPSGAVITYGGQTDVAAVADQGQIQLGVPSIGVLSGSRSRLMGTSGAAPMVARHMVLNVASDRELFAGFDGPLPRPASREVTTLSQAHHAARLGNRTTPRSP